MLMLVTVNLRLRVDALLVSTTDETAEGDAGRECSRHDRVRACGDAAQNHDSRNPTCGEAEAERDGVGCSVRVALDLRGDTLRPGAQGGEGKKNEAVNDVVVGHGEPVIAGRRPRMLRAT